MKERDSQGRVPNWKVFFKGVTAPQASQPPVDVVITHVFCDNWTILETISEIHRTEIGDSTATCKALNSCFCVPSRKPNFANHRHHN